ncbi:MAG: hypothetical protein ACKVIE_01915 [Candidatus Poseidoniales archaeon]|jgi:hypothetical protein|tara:strand:- start:1447 stop:1653 length:207 start_codon:yes stop_codon:yes gene_type:complete
MSVTRGLIFALVSVIPAMIFGLAAYILFDGVTSSPSSSDFMYGPCYGVPFMVIFLAFLYGFRIDVEIE